MKPRRPQTDGRPQEGKVSRRIRLVDDGAWQVDLVVAFFAVLLVVLIVSIPRIASDVQDAAKLDYRTAETPGRPFQLSSFAPVYPRRDVWIAKDGELVLVDLEAVARRFWSAQTLHLEATHDGVDVQVTATDGTIDGYRMRLGIFAPGVPQWLGQQRGKLATVAEAAGLISGARHGALVFVWSSQQVAFAAIADAVRQRGKPIQLVLLEPDNDEVVISRSAAFFELERILRPF